MVFSASRTKKPDPDKGLVLWLKAADGEYMCPHARWHRSIYLLLVKVYWHWPPVYIHIGWACIDCESS